MKRVKAVGILPCAYPLANLDQGSERGGMEAVHRSEVGPAAAPDPVIMAFATPNRFVILTKLSGILQIA